MRWPNALGALPALIKCTRNSDKARAARAFDLRILAEECF